MIVVISLIKPKAAIRGLLRNLLLEPQSNFFVGQLNSKQLGEIVGILENSSAVGIIAVPSKKAFGVRLKQLSGGDDRRVIEYDGIQLMQKQYKSIG